ncbi:hypothetical protein [Photobacterium damselae]|uniref:hypothetical protein n=1 Tax=Photobacterium damselae TaxID=38293 RepID=UPI003F7E51FC
MDINRLVVQDDKITSVTCPTGFCTLPISEEGAGVDPQGAALITIDVLEPFTLYVTTQKAVALVPLCARWRCLRSPPCWSQLTEIPSKRPNLSAKPLTVKR